MGSEAVAVAGGDGSDPPKDSRLTYADHDLLCFTMLLDGGRWQQLSGVLFYLILSQMGLVLTELCSFQSCVISQYYKALELCPTPDNV